MVAALQGFEGNNPVSSWPSLHAPNIQITLEKATCVSHLSLSSLGKSNMLDSVIASYNSVTDSPVAFINSGKYLYRLRRLEGILIIDCSDAADIPMCLLASFIEPY